MTSGITLPLTSFMIAAVATLLMLCGAALGIYLNRRVPSDHLSDATKDIVKLSTGIIATIAGLVLSLLIATAKNSYDAVANDMKSAAADFILIDRNLAQLGDKALKNRQILRQTLDLAAHSNLSSTVMEVDPEDRIGRVARLHEENMSLIRTMKLDTPAEEWLRQRVLSISGDLAKARWMIQQEETDTLPAAFLGVVMLWLAIIFAGFGLFTPVNHTAIGALIVGAVSISASLFLINELNTPFFGLVQISSQPLAQSLKIIGPLP
jgi:hypothetical protein